MPNSQNGWEVLSPTSSKLHTWRLPGGTLLRLRNGSAGFLLCHLALWFDHKIEDLQEPVLDDWGYAYRPIRGYTSWSNHASGTAMDLNATDHPLGVRGTFTAAEKSGIHQRLKLYAGAIRWGEDYTGRVDGMHYEINASLATCERTARRLLDTPRGRRILTANPGQKAVILS